MELNSRDNDILQRIESYMGNIENRTMQILVHTSQIDSTAKILADIRNSLRSLSTTLVLIIVIQAIAVSVGFTMAVRALTNTNASVSGFGMNAGVHSSNKENNGN